MAAQKKILIVLTSAKTFTGSDHPTGWYLPEFAHPYYVLEPHAELVVASPKGGLAPLDPSSIEMFKEDKESVKFLEEKKSIWENTTPLKEFLGRANEFDALFYPGGHGPMFDLVSDKDSIQLIQEFHEAKKPVAAVCHGPIVFRDVKVGGKNLVDGLTVTGFTNVEEDQVKLSSSMPFLLEDELKKAGAKFVKADEPWGVKVVSDDRDGTAPVVISGQNPASAQATGQAILDALNGKK